MQHERVLRGLAGGTLMAFALAALGAPKAVPWERWAAHGESRSAIDHSAWNAFLGRYVVPGKDGVHRVAYGAVTKADRESLDRYLAQLQRLPVRTLPRDVQRAYWINLYNAATVSVVLDHYPVTSIMKIDISPGLFAKGPWGKKLLTVEDEPLSLDDIEHRILRPLWRDPRTHYALNCASLGCPNLATEAYTPGNLERLLDAGARAYVNHPRGARIEDGKLTVSSIYVWFQPDFGGGEAGVLAHLREHAEPALARRLARVDEIDDHAYDWALNDAQ